MGTFLRHSVVYNTGRHQPSGAQFLTLHMVGSCQASLSHASKGRPTHYRFVIFWPWGLPLGQSLPKWEIIYYVTRSTILQNFSPIVQTVYEICVIKVFHSLFGVDFDPSRSSKVKSDGANRKPVGPTYKCSRRSNVVSVTVFEIFRVKILTMTFWPWSG